MAEYLPWAMIHLGALALMLLCAAGVGNLFLRQYPFQSRVERLLFTLALGLGVCSLVLFILGLLGILYQSVIRVLTVSGAVATVVSGFYSHRWSLRIRQWKELLNVRDWKDRFTLRNAVIALLIFIAIGCSILLLITSQYPPTNWDSISNHLVIARADLTEHRLVIVPEIPQPVLPLLNHMLFTWALAMKDDVLAQMFVCTLLLLTALGLYAWGKRQGQAALGSAAAALWLAHPMVREMGATAYVDIGLTCFVFLGVYALRIFWDGRNRCWWYLGIALLAMAAGTKMTGLFFVGLGGLLGLCVLASSRLRTVKNKKEGDAADIFPATSRFNWKSLALGWTLALVIVIPWYAFDSYHMGNPLWPLFSGHSKVNSPVSPLSIKAGSALPPLWGFNQATLRNFLMVYIDFFRDPVRFNAPLNLTLFPAIVVWPLAWIVAVFNRSVRWWVFWSFSFTVFWFLTIPLIRYWLPALPMAGLALCVAIQWILKRIRRSAVLHNAIWATASAVILLWTSYDLYLEINVKELPPTTPAAREGFLSRLHGYLGVKYIEAHADKNDAVCVMRAIWLNYYFNQRLLNEWGKPAFRWPDDQPWIEWLDSQNVKWIVVDFQDRDLNIPKQNPVIDPFWPDYQIVYADHAIWVFHRKPVAPELGFNRSNSILKGLPVKTGLDVGVLKEIEHN